MNKEMTLFLAGGTLYPILELLYRGKTDFSMALAGGSCLCLIDRVCIGRLAKMPLPIKCCAGSGIITAIEFGTGVVVNRILKLNVWDYSNLPLNIMGQVCARYSLLWSFLTIPAMWLCAACDRLTVGRT